MSRYVRDGGGEGVNLGGFLKFKSFGFIDGRKVELLRVDKI